MAFQQRRLEYFQPHICNLASEKLYLDNWRLVRQSYKTQTNSRGTNPVYDDHNFCLQKKLLDSYESALPHSKLRLFLLKEKDLIEPLVIYQCGDYTQFTVLDTFILNTLNEVYFVKFSYSEQTLRK